MGQIKNIKLHIVTDIKNKKYTMDLPDGLYKMLNAKWVGPLFCGDDTDSGGDHWAWVAPDRNYQQAGKELVRLERQVDGTYKIFNRKWPGPLFCGDGTDGNGDHWAYFEPNFDYENGNKERWILQRQYDGTYKVFNKKWGAPLFCGDGTDGSGDHWVWVAPNANYHGNGKEHWWFERVNSI